MLRRLSILFFVGLLSCMQGTLCATSQVSPFTFQEARQTISMADSMRVNEHRLYDDSLALAEAYTTFGRWRLVCPNDYARACYYYGYLLRQHGNQVAAMQAFIAGTHAPYIQRVVPLPWFNDYHILGRIYSNMGTMCHADDAFQLSCDLYELSASYFLNADDSLMYCYAEFSKIFEVISLQKPDSALVMLADAECVLQDDYATAFANLIRGYAYRNMAQYDTALYFADKIAPVYHDPAYLTLKAQCFASLERYDSAILYARRVMEHPSAPVQNKYNVAYIIIHADSCLTESAKDSLIDYRSDLGVMRREEKSSLSHAVEILQLDLQRTPSERKRILIAAVMVLLLMLMIIVFWYLSKWLHKLRIEASLKREVIQEYQLRQSKRLKELEKVCVKLRTTDNLKTELHWNNYDKMREQVDGIFENFTQFILQDYPLNETEVRLCVLIVIDFSQKQIAKLLPCAESSVKTIKRRTAQKCHTDGKNLRNFLLNYIVGDLK